MLKTRVITAVVLLAVLVGILLSGHDLAWQLFVAAVMAAALWEWARLGRLQQAPSLAYALVTTALIAGLIAAGQGGLLSFPIMALSGVFWVVMAPMCLRQVSIDLIRPTALYLPLGLLLVGAACLALLLAKAQGVVFLLSVLAICFAADVFAYFFGKTLGRRKLAPRVSPGKSWEGAIGGAFSVVVLSWALVPASQHWPILQETWQMRTMAHWHPIVFTLWLVVLSAFSVVGDLFESLLKRASGMKDSSNLLPGHGGVLDRIDAQLPVMPLAMLLAGQSLVV